MGYEFGSVLFCEVTEVAVHPPLLLVKVTGAEGLSDHNINSLGGAPAQLLIQLLGEEGWGANHLAKDSQLVNRIERGVQGLARQDNSS